MKGMYKIFKSVFFSFLFLSLIGNAQNEPMITGSFEPTWESLSQFNDAPDWFKDVKFGIWAHWGPQCQPERGDWYARFMYYPGTWQYNHHVNTYGNPAVFGFKDIINIWKADKWNPEYLVKLYKDAGAEYFFAMANHHDNLDMYDSKYQPWNTTRVGPKQDIIAGWANAAKNNGLPFGVSVHSSHAWTWFEPSQDFDGNLTAEDGIGKWWEGLDPQDLYAQRHPRSTGSQNSGTIHSQWNWTNGASIPNQEYLDKFYNRNIDLINKYNPDMLYFDDTALPFTGISDVGLKIAAHMYNKSANENNGINQALIFGKVLSEEQKNSLVWDVERGAPDRPQEKYWQTCTCIGEWHYDIGVYNNNRYKSAATVVRMLIDIISKNGNLLLNIPMRGDGTIDDKALAVVQGITAWMNINKESIHGTRTWATFGEGPNAESVNPISAQGFNEGVQFTARDIRYVSKQDTVYASLLGWPNSSDVVLKSLSFASKVYTGQISKVTLLGYGELSFSRDNDGLHVTFPTTPISTGNIASVIKIEFEPASYSFDELSDLIANCEINLNRAKQNVGRHTGYYSPESISAFENAISTAKSITINDSESAIRDAILALQSSYHNFAVNGQLKGGKLVFEHTQNITRSTLIESRNFSRSDEGAIGLGRWGLLAEPWIVTNNIINQENNTRGGFDNYDSGQSIGIQKWNSSDAAIVDGMIYQRATLPAGEYKLKIKVHEIWGLQPGEVYLNIAEGITLPKSSEVSSKSLAYYDMSQSSTGNEYIVCTFTLNQQKQVSIGWTTTIPAEAYNRSMRVNEILLLDGNENDISSGLIQNYTSIQRRDVSFARFGTPANWTVENFYIPQSSTSDGTKNGIDRYSGYKALMMGVWHDASRSEGNLRDVKMYQELTLPAGHYSFTAGYDAVYQLTEMYMFVSKSVPTLSTLETTAMATYSITGDSNDGTMYGLEFTLDDTETIYLGWIGNLEDGSTQEMRVKEVSLHKILNSNEEIDINSALDVSYAGGYFMDMSEFDSLTNLNWSSSLENVNYVIGNPSGIIDLGYINFGTGMSQTATMDIANGTTISGNQSFDFYINGSTTPFTSIATQNTGGNMYFETLSSPNFELSGIKKVSVHYNGHSSNINSIGFEISPASSVKENFAKNNLYRVYTIESAITIDNVKAGDAINIYNAKGSLIYNGHASQSTISIDLTTSGVYIVRVNSETHKVIIL